jgi:hypothetical protein
MVKGNSYPISEAQLVRSTLLTEAAKPPVKRSARQVAEKRWFGAKRKDAPIALGIRNQRLAFPGCIATSTVTHNFVGLTCIFILFRSAFL